MIEDTAVGHRIYIHQHSFDFLAHQDTWLCDAVEGALARVRGMKLVRHYVNDNWLALGLITRGVADQATRGFEDAFHTLTGLLRQVEYEDPARGVLTPVLDSGDSIVSSCFESGITPSRPTRPVPR
jgi:hypothetical protein